MDWKIINADVIDGLPLADASVQCCVTSPPYWNLRDYGVDDQLGLEETPEEYVEKMVGVFREVRRVLRDDGTLWLNIGDTYNAYNGGAGPGSKLSRVQTENKPKLATGYGLQCKRLKPKDLIGVPWLLAFALRADGWYLRSEIIWHKKAPMPESVRDRPTKAHEQVFLLSKSQRYFYDAVASAEKATGGTPGNRTHKAKTAYENGDEKHRTKAGLTEVAAVETRNMRSVWTLSPESYTGSHFAVMPTELVRRCLLAGTSEDGCCSNCGAPRIRQTEKKRIPTRPGTNSKINRASASDDSPYEQQNGSVVGNRDAKRHITRTETVGWESSCDCDSDPMPCTVLDPFAGHGTTLLVARRMGLHAIGVELNPEYADAARKRIHEDAPLFNGVGK